MLLAQTLHAWRDFARVAPRLWRVGCLVLFAWVWPLRAEVVSQPPVPLQKEIRPLKLGVTVESLLGNEDAHYYELTLEKGQPVEITLWEDGAHLNISLLDHQGKTLANDGSQVNLGTKHLAVVIEQPGIYQVLVFFAHQPGGRYRLEVTSPATLTPQFRARAAAQKLNQAFTDLYGQKYTAPTPDLLRRIVQSAQEMLPLWQASGDTGWEMQTLFLLGDTYKTIGEPQAALETLQRALQLARQTHNASKTAEFLNSLGQTYASLSDYPRALAAYEEALPLWEQSLGGAPTSLVAWNLTNIAGVQNILGEKQRALANYQRADQLYRDFSFDARERERGLGIVANQIGTLYLSLGEKQKAIESQRDALAHFRASGDAVITTFALNGLGEAYASLGETQTALEYFQQALAQTRKNEEPRAEAGVLNNIGRAQVSLGAYDQASETLAQSLAIRRKIGDRRGQALSLTNLGSSKTAQGQHRLALKEHLEALPLWREIGDRYGEAYCLHYLGLSQYRLGERQKAQEYFEQALTLRRTVMDREGEANSLYNLARIERDAQQFAVARIHLETALALTESLRTSVLSQELRASYLATVRDYYELYIELLMQLHERDPLGGFAAQALQAAEKARARSMLETLAEAGGDLREGVPTTLLAQERDLQQRLNAKAEYQIRLQIANAKAELLQDVAREIQTLTAEYQEVRSRIRATSPRYAALTQPHPLSVAEIQSLLNDNTLLLEYALGEERSWLWIISPTTIKTFALPKRTDIETTARYFYQLLTARNQWLPTEIAAQRRLRLQQTDAECAQIAMALSRMILAPAAAELQRKRLLVVAPGALQYVPFAALPEPRQTQPLVVKHELVSLPSASILALLRREDNQRQSTPKTIAVLADPVFSATDERVQAARSRPAGKTVTTQTEMPPSPAPATPTTSPLLRAIADLQPEGSTDALRIARLFGTRWEAEKITAIVPAQQKLIALDFNANRQLALSGELSQYRILHFASHAFINTIHPELSGIVLSLVDKEGKPQDGFLRANEIYNLKLPAELIVLSACQTGLGREVKGEGLIGLTQSFMYAGAPRLIVSLWALQDKATADLMARFYQHLLGPQKLTPAAALRTAQVEMWLTKRWPSPYFWAGFVLQGEWQ